MKMLFSEIMWYEKYGKRIFDLCLTIPLIIAFSPFVCFVTLLIRMIMGSPVFFRQLRPGLHGKPFQIHKFRTMMDLLDEKRNPLPDGQRLTKIGRFLRRLSFDELPELFNVLKGDMSLVGPRPLLMEYLPLYTPEQTRRHEVKPGITGWAQVNGRNALTWEQKFEHDVWYVKVAKGELVDSGHESLVLSRESGVGTHEEKSHGVQSLFALDLKILALTLLEIFKKEGVSHPGMATMEKFKGSRRG